MSMRERNNASVKKCREKKRKEEEEKRLKTEQLKEENSALEVSIKALNNEFDFMVDILKTHSETDVGNAMKNPEFEEIYLLIKEKL